MADIEALRIQQYSTNLELLLQQRGSPFRSFVRKANAAGSKSYRFLSQVGKVVAGRQTGPAEPIDNQAMSIEARWVNMPLPFKFQTIVDDIDLLQTNIEPTGAYVTSAVESLNRGITDSFFSAYYGTAKTGETGSGSTSFTAGNQINVDVGAGAATGLNIEKLRAVKKLAMSKFNDFSFERPVMALNAKAHDDLLALTQVVSTEFNTRPVLGQDGMVTSFMGINFIMNEQIPTDASGYYRLPFWVPSGVGEATWFDIKTDIREQPQLTGKPRLIEAMSCLEFTRLEEDKCYEVKVTA